MGKKLSDAARAMGRKGGQQRAKNLTPEQRREIGRKAAKARWTDALLRSDNPNPRTVLAIADQKIKEMSKKLREAKAGSPQAKAEIAEFFGLKEEQ